MARARNIKPGFYKNEALAECSVWARLIFPGLWMLADREGRMEDRPKRIKAELFPFDNCDADKLLNELARHGFIIRYKNEDGAFIQIAKFLDHQSPHYSEKPSTIKAPINKESTDLQTGKSPGVDAASSQEDSENPQGIKRGSQPPDSLNPDSLNPESLEDTAPASGNSGTSGADQPPAGALPPDGGKATPKPGSVAEQAAAALDALRVTPAVGTDEHDAAGALWAVLAANGCRGTAAHPSVVEMARAGVTVAELRAGIAEARKTREGQLNPAYLAAIVARMRTEPAKANGKSAAWATDERATEAKARELGLWPAKIHESWDDLRNRIRAKLSESAAASVR